jgi:hypothetical protein
MEANKMRTLLTKLVAHTLVVAVTILAIGPATVSGALLNQGGDGLQDPDAPHPEMVCPHAQLMLLGEEPDSEDPNSQPDEMPNGDECPE